MPDSDPYRLVVEFCTQRMSAIREAERRAVSWTPYLHQMEYLQDTKRCLQVALTSVANLDVAVVKRLQRELEEIQWRVDRHCLKSTTAG